MKIALLAPYECSETSRTFDACKGRKIDWVWRRNGNFSNLSNQGLVCIRKRWTMATSLAINEVYNRNIRNNICWLTESMLMIKGRRSKRTKKKKNAANEFGGGASPTLLSDSTPGPTAPNGSTHAASIFKLPFTLPQTSVSLRLSSHQVHHVAFLQDGFRRGTILHLKYHNYR